ncbi:transketolase family protein [Maridesulfovibrio frigidus]|uniref:transketolase family protein n=1 Tax=Maridesulfovibrio frigidus TaxID=340956 RepID=UPI0004E27064|nr:transketolase C-terminal domain-containing protein [Maridesulfovibrio frigidus]
MRKACLQEVHRLAGVDERVVFIGSDLGFGTLDEMRKDYPKRFFMEGISEANILGMAAGMALDGWMPYVNTIAPFITRRAYEQVIVDLCMHNVPVRLIGNGGGVVYAPLGPTHQAIEDLAVMRAAPNMTVVAVADADEMRRLMPLTLNESGPIYIRLAKGYDPIVTDDSQPFIIGRGLPFQKGKDLLLVTTGIGLRLARESMAALEAKGLSVGLLHMPTIKPFDSEMLLEMASQVKAVISVEEHSVIGGLGSAVAEVLAEACLDKPLRFKRLGLPDCFADSYGSQLSLMAGYGLSADGIVEAAKGLLEI